MEQDIGTEQSKQVSQNREQLKACPEQPNSSWTP